MLFSFVMFLLCYTSYSFYRLLLPVLKKRIKVSRQYKPGERKKRERGICRKYNCLYNLGHGKHFRITGLRGCADSLVMFCKCRGQHIMDARAVFVKHIGVVLRHLKDYFHLTLMLPEEIEQTCRGGADSVIQAGMTHGLLEIIVHLLDVSVKDFGKNLLFRPEVIVKHRMGYAGLSGNQCSRGAFESLLLEEGFRCFEDSSLGVDIFFHLTVVFNNAVNKCKGSTFFDNLVRRRMVFLKKCTIIGIFA